MKPCPHCDGHGEIREYDFYLTCPACDGSGERAMSEEESLEGLDPARHWVAKETLFGRGEWAGELVP
jgi:DnaJ-class molecular chaperone